MAPKVWSPDLAVALIGIAELLIGLGNARLALNTLPAETRSVTTWIWGAILIVLVGLQTCLIFRRRWSMWLLFALYLIGLGGTLYQRSIGGGTFDPLDISFLFRMLMLVYLPLRLFRVFGPAPK